ncbi:MAG: RNA polymerase sigma factor [Candidatus Kapabacteria bacterium]|nr:RNA polymerase sigma factor [Candidatus Kapabacteria bacterium]
MNKYSHYSDYQLTELLKGNKNDSEKAFTEIYTRYSHRLYAYCLRMVGNTEDASDIFQECFLKFYNSSKNEAYIDNIRAYLFRIARNLCINKKRSHKHFSVLNDDNLISSDTDYADKELMDILISSLDVLDFEYREVFILRQFQGLSYKEIAEITGEPLSTLKNRVWRAKEKLKTILTHYLEDI